MGSNSLPFGLSSGGYSCSAQYDWQQLTLRQREQATWKQPHRGANANNPVHALSRTERTSMSVDPGCDHAEGDDGHIHATVSPGKFFQFDQGSSTQNASYQEDRYVPTYSPVSHFSEIDEVNHRAYMDNLCTKSKPDHTSAGRPHHRDEESQANTKKPFDKLHTIHPVQLELSPGEDFHDQSSISQNCRSKYRGKMFRTAKENWTSKKNNSHRSCISTHGRNRRQARYRDQLSEPKAKNSGQKRYRDQVSGEKAKKRMTCKEHPKEFCSIREQDEQSYLHHEVHCGGSDVIRNDNREDKAETPGLVGHSGAKGNCHPTKNILTAATCCGSTKSNENSYVLNPKYSSKTIASSNSRKQSEGSSNMKLESDKQHSVVDCTGNTAGEVSTCNLQHLPSTHMEKGVHTKQSDSAPSELIRECLDIWRRTRRLRKDSDAEAEKLVQTNQTVNVRYTKSADFGSSESEDGNINASVSPSGSSESTAENVTALDHSEKCKSATPDGLQMREGRAKTNPERLFRCLTGSNCNKSSSKQGLMCSLEVLPEPKPVEVTQQNKEAKIPRYTISTVHPNAMVQISQNSCSDTSQIEPRHNVGLDTSKVDQAVALHPDCTARQNVSQQKAINNHLDLDSRRKYKLGARAEGDAAKLCEQIASLTTGPTLPNDGNVKFRGSDCFNQGSETTPFSVSNFDKGTTNCCPKKPYGCSKGGDCSDMPLDTMNFKRNKQMSSELGDYENDVCHEGTEDDYQLPEVLEVPLNEEISLQSDADIANSSVAKPADSAPHFAIPDLNCLPSMTADEERYVASEEVINQVTGHVSIPQDTSQSFSTCSGTAVQIEQAKQPEKNESTGGHVLIPKDASQSFSACSGTAAQDEQSKQPKKKEFAGGVCEREIANEAQISESHIGPPQVSCVEESSASTQTFRFALGEFIKNILKPLWEEGLLSRDVHKLIVKKAVDKVTLTLGKKVPRTEAASRRFVTEEESSVEQLIQGYLDVYLGKQVLKRTIA